MPSPGGACAYCVKKRVACSFASHSNGGVAEWTTRSSASPQTQTSTSDFEFVRCQSVTTSLPTRPLCIELTELYFRYIHDTFHSIFHRPSVMQDVANGTLPKVLLFGIVSLSARFSSDPFFSDVDARFRGRPYAREAEHLLNLREISLTTIQATILIGAYAITEGDARGEAVCYGIACRNALLVDLPNMLAPTRVEQEVNRRIWWTLNMIDVWSSKGVGLPRSIHPRNDVPYPMEETVFLQLRREDFDLPSSISMQESAASLLTQMVKLNAILVEIQNLNQLAASYPVFQHSHHQIVDDLTARLEGWYNSLPIELQDTHANLSRYASLGLGHMFVAVYLGYYNYGQLLYYQFLHEDAYDDTTFARYYADKCKSHAAGLLDITYRAYAEPGCEVYYTMVGHILVVASTVQLHTLLFSEDEVQIRAARSRLEKNFEILSKLQTFWPTLDASFTRFREFHKACQKSRETSFRMDRWMLQFLFEFAKPVGEKDAEDLAEVQPWSMTELGFSPYGV